MPPQVEDHGASESSSEISSPPQSPPQPNQDSIVVARRHPYSAHSLSADGVVRPPAATSAQPSPATQTATTATSTLDAPPKAKRVRKKKEPDAPGDEKLKEKKPRKPREPKIKKEGETGSAAAAPRKRQKIEDKSTPLPSDAPAGPRQSTLTEMVSQFQAPALPATTSSHQLPTPPQYITSTLPQSQSRSQHAPIPGNDITRSGIPPHAQSYASNPPTPRPYSSGQNYDPIRGMTTESVPPRTSAPTNGHHSAQHSPHINRASASPSIISLIDPPPATKPTAYPASYSPQTTMQQAYQPPPPPPFPNTQQHSPTPPRVVPTTLPTVPTPTQTSPAAKAIPTMDDAMDVDAPVCAAPPKTAPPEVKVQSKSSSSAPTPKPAPVRANSSPKGTGSGLLGNDLFGGSSSKDGSERKGVDIEIRITLDRNGGNTINMAQEIAKKYGRDAINPRAAAHRQRLLEVAAQANKLEGGSADDMSVDLMSEADGDSNVEMGGMEEDGITGETTADGKPRKRRKKVEEYDKEDDFIDDTELAWQEQAAVAKDGFFVYSGPLIPEGSTAQVESSTSTRGSRGGRGRGRGRGAAAASAAGTTHASLAAEKKEASTRGRGRGRGTGAPRKPRITKADRERMEAEKMDRERMAGGPPPNLAPSSSMTSTVASTHQPPPPPTQTLYSNVSSVQV